MICQMYSVGDLQRIWNRTRQTIHNWEKSGEIPPSVKFKTMGKRWPGAHLVKWYDRQFTYAAETAQ